MIFISTMEQKIIIQLRRRKPNEWRKYFFSVWMWEFLANRFQSDQGLKKFFEEMKMYLESDLSSRTNFKELSDLFSVMAILSVKCLSLQQ